MKTQIFTVHPRILYNQTCDMFGIVELFGESKTSKERRYNYVSSSSTILDATRNGKA